MCSRGLQHKSVAEMGERALFACLDIFASPLCWESVKIDKRVVHSILLEFGDFSRVDLQGGMGAGEDHIVEAACWGRRKKKA